MAQRRFFPASIVDETAFFLEQAARSSFTIHGLLALEGEVSSEAIGKALDASLDLYPKFRCVLARNYPSVKRWFRYCWEYRDLGSKDILTEIEVLDPKRSSQEVLDYFMENHYAPSLDLTQHVPLRVTLIRQIGRVILVFCFHHAATDGLGGLFFVRSFVKFYEEIFYDHSAKCSCERDFESISQPEMKMRLSKSSFRLVYDYIKYLNTFIHDSPVQLNNTMEGFSNGKVVAVSREIPPHQFKAIRSAASTYRITLNDYLLITMFQAIKKWNQGNDGTSGRIRINVQVNLRQPGDYAAGNLLSGFNLSLPAPSINEKSEIIEMLSKQRASLITSKIPQISRDLAGVLRLVPIALKKTLSKYNLVKVFSPTISLSNLGVYAPNPSHTDEEGFHYLGDARIARITPLTFALPWPQVVCLTYNERLIINLTVFSSTLSQEAAEGFLNCFIDQLID